MKLTIELVPRTAWGCNLRKVVSATDWDRLRKLTFQRDDYRCSYCDDRRKIQCHERWLYKEQEHRQILAALTTLCHMCHHVKHLGLAETLASRGKLDIKIVIDHFCRVNQCSVQSFLEHRQEAFCLWEARSQHDWTCDLRLLSQLLKKEIATQ